MYSQAEINTKLGQIIKIDVVYEEIEISFLNIGASIYSLKTLDINNDLKNIVLMFEDIEDYFSNSLYLNASIGPHSGRIKDAKYKLNDRVHELDKNQFNNNLHSGAECTAFKVFDYNIIEESDKTIVIFKLNIKDNDNFPGNKDLKIIYTVGKNFLEIKYEVTSDKDTIMNLTNHTYFNLSGDFVDDISNHKMAIKASKIVKTDETFVSKAVIDIPKELDFRIEKRIDNSIVALKDSIYKGIDHSIVLDNHGYDSIQASLYSDVSKRFMKVYTSYPIIHVYTHNFQHKEYLLGQSERMHLGICFEAQFMSNGINLNDPSSTLKKGDLYQEFTKFEFGIRSD